MKQKRPQIGDLVRVIEYEPGWTDLDKRFGVVVGHCGIRSEVEWNDGTYSEPMRAVLEVL